MNSPASTYWAARRASDTARKAMATLTADRLWWHRVNAAAVASVLPGYAIPDALAALPVLIHSPQGYPTGVRLVCRHLA